MQSYYTTSASHRDAMMRPQPYRAPYSSVNPNSSDLEGHGRRGSNGQQQQQQQQQRRNRKRGGGGCCCHGWFCTFYVNPESRPEWLARIERFTTLSTVYRRVFVTGFSLFLLFGPAVQRLASVGATGDALFLGLRIATLFVFGVDITIRCLLEENYFVLALCHRAKGSAHNAAISTKATATATATTTTATTSSTPAASASTPYGDPTVAATETATKPASCCSAGSFLFWCDVISTMTILYDLSFVNRQRFSMVETEITVANGFPTPESFSSGYHQFRRLAPNSLEFGVVVVILRTLRCARFVRSRAAIGISNRIDWYRIYKLSRWLNPFFLYYLWQERKKRKRNRESNQQQQRQRRWSNDETEPTTTDPAPSGRGVTTNNDNNSSSSNNNDDSSNNEEWNTIDNVLATIRADAEREALEGRRQKAKTTQQRQRQGWWTNPKSAFGSKESLVVEHNQSATKIQEAWRRNRVRRSELNNNNQRIDAPTNPDDQSATRVPNPVPEKTTRLRKLSFALFNDDAADGGIPTRRSRFLSKAGKGHGESQVGSDTRELTGKRVAIATLLLCLCTVLCTYTSSSTAQAKTMVLLHSQTKTPAYTEPSLAAAVRSSTPTLYKYRPVGGSEIFPNPDYRYDDTTQPIERNIVKISVTDSSSSSASLSLEGGRIASIGWFDNSRSVRRGALVDIVATLFVIMFWLTGVISLAGPVMVLVVAPVEHMVRLLSILTLDPLGYQSTERYQEFLLDEDHLSKNTIWSKEVLKGMETALLKSTILRIGSLMKVGFGSAGVEIIRNNLEKGGRNSNSSNRMLVLNSQGTTVSCIFLFCDIRQFTDATEQLQEEVFMFTNRVAAVVHSICNSYGGAANKNIGDAFLVSWSIDNDDDGDRTGGGGSDGGSLQATANQADRALLSVVKISIASTYDDFFLEPLSDAAKGRLTIKLKDRFGSGSVLRVGIGLHAGRAVQGAIGSQRKIDATYVSESVERTEFLESSTKKYGLNVMMSGDFHRLLHPHTQGRCRKVDRIRITDNDSDSDDEHRSDTDIDSPPPGEIMDLFTFDMDVDAIQQRGVVVGATDRSRNVGTDNDRESDTLSMPGSLNNNNKNNNKEANSSNNTNTANRQRSVRKLRNRFSARVSRLSVRGPFLGGSGRVVDSKNDNNNDNTTTFREIPELVLPTGPVRYSPTVWQSAEMKTIREKYYYTYGTNTNSNTHLQSDSFSFFQKYRLGLDAFYNKDWSHAERCFRDILERFEDGPSRYFLGKIEQHKGVPPKDFRPYGIA